MDGVFLTASIKADCDTATSLDVSAVNSTDLGLSSVIFFCELHDVMHKAIANKASRFLIIVILKILTYPKDKAISSVITYS